MPTVADLEAEIGLNPQPFVAGVKIANAKWNEFLTDISKTGAFTKAEEQFNKFSSAAKGLVSPLEQAFKTLGVTSQAELNKAAMAAQNAFEIIRKSATSTAKDVDQAYRAMAKASADAAGMVEAQAKRQSNALAEIGPQIKQAGTQLQIFGAVMVGAFGGAITYAVKAASDLSEALNKVNVVFGESASSIQQFAQSSATNLGLSQQAALDYAGSLGNMFVAMKLTNQGAAELSMGILALAADIASFNNIGVDDALMKLKSGLQGEAEPLRSVGVLLSDVAIKAKAAEIGISGASDKLSEQQKVLLRYLVILDQTEKAQGDFARTSTGMANSMRILQAQFEDLSAKIGEKFLGSVTGAMGVVVQLMSVFNNLPPSILATGAAFLAVEAAVGTAALAIGGLVALLGGPLTLAFAGIVAWAGAVAIGIAQNWEAVQAATQGLGIGWQGAFRTMAKAAGYLVDIISAVSLQVITAFDVILNGARILAKGVVAAFQVIGQNLSGIFSAILSGNVVSIAMAFTNTFSSAFQSVGAAIGSEMADLGRRAIGNFQKTGEFLMGKTANAFAAAFDKGVEQAKSFDFAKLKQKILDELNGLQSAAGDAGKKGGKGAAEAAKKAMIDSVNEMLDALKVGVKINKEYWDKINTDTKAGLLAQAAVIKQLNKELTDIAIERALSEGRSVEISITNWRKLSDAVKDALTKAGIAVKVTFPGIIDEFKLLELTMGNAEKAAGSFGREMEQAADKISNGFKEIFEAMEVPPTAVFTPEKFGLGIKMREALEQLRDDVKSILGDGIGGVLVGLADKFGWNLQKVRGWAGDVGNVIATMPGKFGDMVRGVYSTLDQWLSFGNSVLSILKRLEITSVGSIGDLFTKLKGQFSAGFGKLLGIAGSFAGSLASFFGAKGAGVGGGAVMGGIGGFLGFSGIAKALGFTVTGLGGPIGLAAIGIGSLLGGLFGRKSSAQKKAEEEAKKQAQENAKISMQEAAQGVINSALEGFQKAMDFLENLDSFTAPRKAKFQEFFKSLQRLLDNFVEMSKAFTSDTLASAKALAETVGPVSDAISGSVQAMAGIFEVPIVETSKIQSFFSSFKVAFDLFAKMADEVANDVQKRAARFGERLGPVVEAIDGIVGPLKELFDFTPVDPSRISAFTNNLSQLALSFGSAMRMVGMEIVKEGARYAAPLQQVIEAIKSTLEVATSLSTYTEIPQAVFDAVTKDLQKLVDWAGSLITLGEEGITRFETLQSVISRMAAAMKGAGGAIAGLAAGAGSSATQSLIYEPNFRATTAGAGGGGQTVINNYNGNVTNMISFRELQEILRLPDALRRLEELMYSRMGSSGQQTVATNQI